MLVHYPLVANVLRELHEVMPLPNYLQYVDAFTKKGLSIPTLSWTWTFPFFVDIIGIPHTAICPFIDCANVVVRKAGKGKGKAVSIKEEDEEVILISD